MHRITIKLLNSFQQIDRPSLAELRKIRVQAEGNFKINSFAKAKRQYLMSFEMLLDGKSQNYENNTNHPSNYLIHPYLGPFRQTNEY